MKKDLDNRQAIEEMVNLFYDLVKKNEVIGKYFTTIIPVNWDKHLPVMYNFWENIILGNATYNGNPMIPHQSLHQIHPLTAEDFQVWVTLFEEILDEYFEGVYTEKARQRAHSISTVMQLKTVYK